MKERSKSYETVGDQAAYLESLDPVESRCRLRNSCTRTLDLTLL
jgi:hypothetical protein